MNWLKKVLAASFALAMTVTTMPKAVIAEEAPSTGVTITENTDYPDSDAEYQVTFRYAAPEGTQSVSLIGGFTFYTADQEAAYAAGEAITYTTPYEYKKGMFPTGYAVSEYNYAPFPMEKNADGIYEITMPLPGFEYFYDFQVTDAEGKVSTVKDPTNLPFVNNGKDAGHSLLWVGDGEHCVEGQEYVYPRTDGKTGEVTYIDYEDVNGNTQTIGVYTPYGYDASKTYKTMYICHGGGGNEVEWFHIGAAANIFDNLIAEGEVEPTVVVSMNNTVYNFERGPSVQNIIEKIIPLVESRFSVSKDAKDRAIGGLSSGASVTCQALLYNVDEFNYYGIWSPSRTLDFVNNTLTDEMKEGFLKPANIYVSVGIFDSAVRRNVNMQIDDVLNEVGANHEFFWKNGAHDWGVWRNQLSQFAKDYLWEDVEMPVPGVVIEENTDYPESDAPYQVTFTYKTDRDVASVGLVGNWSFYTEDQVATLQGGTDIDYYTPYEYKEGMFNTGYTVAVKGGGYAPIEMKKLGSGYFTVTVPLPGFEYFYGYAENGDLGAIKKDPTNMPFANDGSDSGWSLIWVGDKDNCLEGQEYIYPRNYKKGTVEFKEYTAVDGTTQPYGIYLPYDYDPANTYKVLYLSHGGGGNEVEWMFIGAAANIFDNLIAEGELESSVIVTMDNTYFGWDPEKMNDNSVNCLIPAVEAEYSVARDKAGRAFAGLSMGGYTTVSELVKASDTFQYYGIFSPNFRAVDALKGATEEQLAALKDNYYYQACGSVDNGMGNQDRYGTVAFVDETLKQYSDNVVTEWKNGAHDWGIWRASLTTFAKDYLWKDTVVTPGVVIEENTDYPDSDASYQVTFTYKASSTDVKSVSLVGNWTFYTEDQVDILIGGTDIDYTLPYDYKEGMFNTGYAVGVKGAGYAPIEMENLGYGYFRVTLPLPGNEYFYGFAEDGNLGAIKKDPTNMPFANDGSDSGWSLIWVGNGEDCLEGQEYIYARDDEQVGTIAFETYTAVDGTEQPYGIYLPYGYDEANEYPVLYLSHGGGGNEVEWMFIGSAKNIFDNLIAAGEVDPTIVVTMDNTYFGWDMEKISDNMRNYLIPAIEGKYSTKKDKDGRAFAGLSQGGYTTTSELVKSPDLYRYFGIFSSNYRAKDLILEQATEEELLALKDNIYYQSCGWVDNGNGSQDRRGTIAYIEETLKKYSDNYHFDWKKGAHDWAVWRAQLTTLAKDYLWKGTPEAGVVIEENTDFPEVETDYQATFTFVADEDYEKVELIGNFQFYDEEGIKAYELGGTPVCHAPTEYKPGMINTGYDVATMTNMPIEMKKADNVYTITLPLPATEYCYAFQAVKADGTTEKILDPTNLPYTINGSNCRWSLIYVGSADDCLPGQEYIYPRTDEKTGTWEYVEYTTNWDAQDVLYVYLPYGYDETKEYKTLYLNGSEYEWPFIGAANNIFDNLIAEGLLEPTVIVTTNLVSAYRVDASQGIPIAGENTVKAIIPYVEEHYSVSKNPLDRAIAGLSINGVSVHYMAGTYPEEFGYFASFSGGSAGVEFDAAVLNSKVIYESAGVVDYCAELTAGALEDFDNAGVRYVYEVLPGAHDWGIWRQSLTIFARDFLWKGYTGFKDAEGNKVLHPAMEDGDIFWYENGKKQGVYGDPLNIWDTQYDKLERGREIYDPVSDAWYWLDACYDGAVARDKEVWMPYVFQGVEDPEGKWVRYDKYGAMIKGWYANDNGVYYYDLLIGAMLKGTHEINGKIYTFDELTGIRK